MQLPWVSRARYEAVVTNRDTIEQALRQSQAMNAQLDYEHRFLRKLIEDMRTDHATLLEKCLDRPRTAPTGEIPDPPSVSAADARVAVALRDREAAPLKRPLRPGEDA